jgi:alpha-glucosidase
VWWRDAVLYQIYPRSFADSNGDGIGDLRGIVQRLSYLEWLGVDGIWLNPTMPSPNVDWGYDVGDHCDVHPDLGTLDDLDDLVAEAGRRGIRVLLDLVPNHTSDRHPWFEDARSSRSARHRDWYVWADGKGDGSPPNNWLSAFGGPAWTFDDHTRQWYLHNFAAEQPDLNWWNDEVRDAFDDILRFWAARGVAGFRIDVANSLIHDAQLRDNPPAGDEDDPWARRRGQSPVYNANRPEVHEIYRRWRRIAEGYDPPLVLLGEAWVWDIARWAKFFGDDDELQLLFDFRYLDAPFGTGLRNTVAETRAALPPSALAALAGSNHDVIRFPTRWCDDDPARVRLALLALLTLRGTPFLYYGDEIGMPDVPVPEDRVRDVATPSRDPARTPMQWADEPGGGFTAPGVEPWLPFGDLVRCNAAAQRSDESSILEVCRNLIAFRRTSEDLRRGDYQEHASPPGVWAWRRGERTVVAINFGERDAVVGGCEGSVAVATDREREGERISGGLRLRPNEGVIVTA